MPDNERTIDDELTDFDVAIVGNIDLALGNKIVSTKKSKKLTSVELRKKKKHRMARRKRGEKPLSDEDD